MKYQHYNLRKPGGHGKCLMEYSYQYSRLLQRETEIWMKDLRNQQKMMRRIKAFPFWHQGPKDQEVTLRVLDTLIPSDVKDEYFVHHLVPTFSFPHFLQEQERAIGEALQINPKFYENMEVAVHAETLDPKRDEHGYPQWSPNIILKNGRHPLAGEYKELCFRTVCQRPNATWWNRGSYSYYCEDCARMLNRENSRFGEKWEDGRPMCVERTSEEDQSVFSHMVFEKVKS